MKDVVARANSKDFEKQIELLKEASEKLITGNTIEELLPDFKSGLETAEGRILFWKAERDHKRRKRTGN